MLVGIFAGLLAFGFARVFGEPQIDRAIAFEELMAQQSGETPDEEPELVSRGTQAGLGLLTGSVVYGAAIGGLFSLVFAYAYGRVSNFGPRGTAALLALAGFIAVVLIPQIKYPATPPAVGNPDTIGVRTELFFIMIVVSIATMVASIGLARRLWAQYGAWNASIIAGAAFLAVTVIAQYALPTINDVPENFSADLLWRFRTASLGMHVVLWAAIGLAFGAVVERNLAGRSNHKVNARPALR
jgi:predicted cobalt transporter CbtA